MKRKIVVAIGGASGSILARILLEKLKDIKTDQNCLVNIVMSKNAYVNWALESPHSSIDDLGFKVYTNDDFNAPFASGSARFDTMIICPASMGQIGRIAHGISNDLISRAADVMLKERRKLIFVPREAPFSLIHLKNMTLLTESGAIICPAIPSFYSLPKSIDELLSTVTNRVLELADFDTKSYRWGE